MLLSCCQVTFADVKDFVIALCAIASLVVSIVSFYAARANRRPVVCVDIEFKNGLYMLVVKNTSHASAFKIHLHLSPCPRINLPIIGLHDIPFIVRDIPLLHPGDCVECAFAAKDTISSISKEQTFRGEVTYSDERAKKLSKKVDIDVRLVFDSVIVNDEPMKNVVVAIDKVASAVSSLRSV